MPNISQEDRDKSSPVWDLSQERVLLTSMVTQRFQFLLLVFSLVVAGALNARSQSHMIGVFVLGLSMTVALAGSLNHARRKLGAVHKRLLQDPTHPYTLIKGDVGNRPILRVMMGHVLPVGSWLLLLVATVLAALGVITPAPR
ncbi:hypothetical protein J8F10_29715 [Gemmata sp. G18]|uniref:Uncharacterized protein n=1 Tax=Gemmata palustris TaxID=2822762 RepID=A0ABS5C1A4_9BACT|nr:hypothetical protein [Gemmata palustris]MBP3959442.1 hypothetical protein [Gemmata palustris]